MKSIKLKVYKYRGNMGEIKSEELIFNQDAIAYVDTSNEKLLTFQLIGDPNKYTVKDQDSINKLIAIL